MARKESQPTLAQVFANLNFLKFWVGQLISYLGDRIDQMAMIAVVTIGVDASTKADRTNMITFWATLPYVLLSPFAGALIDRYDRRKLMVLMDIVRGAVVLILPFTLAAGLHQTGAQPLQPWVIYVIIGLIGAATCVFAPAKSAFIPEIVESDHLLRANSVTSTMGTLTVLLGTVIGGLMVATLHFSDEWPGYRVSLILDALSYFVSAALLLWIRMPKIDEILVAAREREVEHEGSFLVRVKDGFTFLAKARIPAVSVALDSWFFCVGGLLFTVVSHIVHERIVPPGSGDGSGVQYLGYSYGCLGLGLAVGGILTGRYGGRILLNTLICTCYACAAFFVFLLIFQNTGFGVYFCLAGLGYSAGGVVVCIETTLQKAVPDELRGRVFALNGLLLNTVLLVAIFVGTMLLSNKTLSVNAMLAVTGLIAVAGGLLAFFGYPARATLNSLKGLPTQKRA